MAGGNAAIRDDGRLSLEVVPGTYRLSAFAATLWLVKRILYRGLEAESEEVDLTPAPGGRIEYTVLIFPADSELARRTD